LSSNSNKATGPQERGSMLSARSDEEALRDALLANDWRKAP
jgi:hypothetical protein